MASDAEFIEHKSCEKCGSSDANAVYDDGSTYCFSCTTYVNGSSHDTSFESTSDVDPELSIGHFHPLVKRGISRKTCEKFDYRTAVNKDGTTVQRAAYRNSAGETIAHKCRVAGKGFWVTVEEGKDFKDAQLFGQHLWKAGGKMICITEGEIDALSLAQIQGLKWPVVSVPNGAQGASKALANQLEWLSTFERIVLMFDGDKAGRDAAKEAAKVLPVGKAHIAELPDGEDANSLMLSGRSGELLHEMWESKQWRPDGMIRISDMMDEILKPVERGLPWFLEGLTDATMGRRYSEIIGFGGGTGSGKSDLFVQQAAYDVHVLKQRIGLFFLEQQPAQTAQRIASKIAGKKFFKVDRTPEETLELEEVLRGIEDRIEFYNHWGYLDYKVIENNIRHYNQAEGIRIFYLDHLTALADTTKEKESLETMMRDMASLAQELDILIHFISHLSRPANESKGHEDGAQVRIRNFKGSSAIAFWSHVLLGWERDQQDEDSKQIATLRCLKERQIGDATGKTWSIYYDMETGLLMEYDRRKAQDHGF